MSQFVVVCSVSHLGWISQPPTIKSFQSCSGVSALNLRVSGAYAQKGENGIREEKQAERQTLLDEERKIIRKFRTFKSTIFQKGPFNIVCLFPLMLYSPAFCKDMHILNPFVKIDRS
jgi:hypothetical protein